nr:MAG TPA: hypothetical protein [Caudoviricetes sp.]
MPERSAGREKEREKGREDGTEGRKGWNSEKSGDGEALTGEIMTDRD